MGGSQHLVRRLVRELGKVGLETEVAWTPDERRALVAEAGRGRRLPMPGRRRWRWHRLGADQRAAQGPDQRAARGDGEPRRTALSDCGETLPCWPGRSPRASVTRTDVGLRRGPAVPADDRVRLRRRRRHPAPPLTRDAPREGSSPRIGRLTSSQSSVPACSTASLRSACGSSDPDGPRRCSSGTTVFVFNLPRYALGLAVRSPGLPGRRPARPGRLPRPGPVPGPLLPLARVPRHAPGPSRGLPPPRPAGAQ